MSALSQIDYTWPDEPECRDEAGFDAMAAEAEYQDRLDDEYLRELREEVDRQEIEAMHPEWWHCPPRE